MSRTFADAMAEVQNRANMHRKEISAESWGGEIAPGGRGIIVNEKPLPSSELEAQIAEVHAQRNQSVKNMTKENWDETIPVTDIATVDHINNVEEAKKAIDANKKQDMNDKWGGDKLVSPIPTMKDPKMATTPKDKKPADMREALAQVQKNVAEGAASDAAGSTIGSVLRGDWGKARKSAGEWGSAMASNADKARTAVADYLDPAGAKPAPAPAPAPAPSTSSGSATLPSMASAPAPSSLNNKPNNVVSQDKQKAPGGGSPTVKPAAAGGSYKINKGDTLSAISKKTGLSIQQIAKQNNIKDVNKIRAGASLNLSGSKPSTAGVVSQDTKPKPPKVVPVPPRRPGEQGPPMPKRLATPTPNVAPSGGTGVAGGNPTPTTGGSIAPRTSPSATALSRPADSKSQQNFLQQQLSTPKKTVPTASGESGADYEKRLKLNNSYENPMIAAFIKLQETPGNMFEAAKKVSKKDQAQAKKYNKGDEDEIQVDPKQSGEVATSQAPGAVAESIQKPARVSMFDPGQGYSRTAGSADGAASFKERMAAAWNSLSTGYPATQPAVTGMSPEIAADMAALKEETEVLDEAPSKKDHGLAALAAAAISKGHPVKKLPAGRAQDAVLPKGMYGGAINHESGVKRQAKIRSEEIEQVNEISKKTLDGEGGYREKAFAASKKAMYSGDKETERKRDKGREMAFHKITGRAKVNATEEVQFSAEELAHIQAVMENNPEGNAIAGRDPNATQGDNDKSTTGGIANESKKKKM